MKKLFTGLFLFFAVASPGLVRADLEESLKLLNSGKTDEAMEIVKANLKADSDSPDNHMAMGLIHIDKKDYGQAKENFRQALRINKKIVAAHYMLAMIYEKENDVAQAIDKWKKIVRYSKDGALKSLAKKHIKQLKGQLE
ncbi:MAG: tetratricopeptide repeat protein [Endomicrobium sp.]|jgi:tetratricopeptide (TPR) repeat protein|nr:tetratricopeptide repeat protein [Endomicrobium sp.]